MKTERGAEALRYLNAMLQATDRNVRAGAYLKAKTALADLDYAAAHAGEVATLAQEQSKILKAIESLGIKCIANEDEPLSLAEIGGGEEWNQ